MNSQVKGACKNPKDTNRSIENAPSRTHLGLEQAKSPASSLSDADDDIQHEIRDTLSEEEGCYGFDILDSGTVRNIEVIARRPNPVQKNDNNVSRNSAYKEITCLYTAPSDQLTDAAVKVDSNTVNLTGETVIPAETRLASQEEAENMGSVEPREGTSSSSAIEEGQADSHCPSQPKLYQPPSLVQQASAMWGHAPPHSVTPGAVYSPVHYYSPLSMPGMLASNIWAPVPTQPHTYLPYPPHYHPFSLQSPMYSQLSPQPLHSNILQAPGGIVPPQVPSVSTLQASGSQIPLEWPNSLPGMTGSPYTASSVFSWMMSADHMAPYLGNQQYQFYFAETTPMPYIDKVCACFHYD